MSKETSSEFFNSASNVWTLIESVMSVRPQPQPIHFEGPPAIGKSYAAKHTGLADDKGNTLPVYAVTLTEDMSAARLVGYERFTESGASIFTPGPMLLAWGLTGKPGRLVLDEIDCASGDVLTTCLCALDDPSHAQYVLPTGEVARPHQGYSVVATSNESLSALPPALGDRLAISFQIRAPHPDAIKALPEDLRTAAERSTVMTDDKRRISIRAWYSYAHLRERIGVRSAGLAVFGPSFDDVLAAHSLATEVVAPTRRTKPKTSSE